MAGTYRKEELESLSTEDFSMVDKDERIFDKKFETKPVGYFRDAMSRFARNRTNVVASLILFTMIMMAIFVPILTTKSYEGIQPELQNLGPRWPIVERWGIMDGSRAVTEVRVDRDTIDPETGIGLPYSTVPDYLPEQFRRDFMTYNEDYIYMDTLTNEIEPCFGYTIRDSNCYGGEVIFGYEGNHRVITLLTDDTLTLDPDKTPTLTFNVPINAGIRSISVMVSFDGGATYTNLRTLYESRSVDVPAGEHLVDFFAIMDSVDDPFDTQIKITMSSRDETVHENFEMLFNDQDNDDVAMSTTVDSLYYSVTMESLDAIAFDGAFADPKAVFELLEMTEGTTIDVMVRNQYNAFQTVGSITDVVTSEISVYGGLDHTSPFSSPLRFALRSESDDIEITIESIAIQPLFGDPIYEVSGWSLARFSRASGETTGYKSRTNATRHTASFRYDSYGAAFDEQARTMGRFEYEALLDEYGDRCEITDHPFIEDDPNAWGFESPDPDRPCIFSRVDSRTSSVPGPGGVDTFSYRLYINYAVELGYDTYPFFYFGTNSQGQDMFALTWFGLRTSLMLGLIASLVNITIGIIYGSISGYYGGKVDLAMERFAELISRIPWLVTLSIFMALIGPGALTLILILIVSGWVGIAGVTRTQFYRYKGREYVLASRTLGAKDSRLIFRHILPNGIGTIITASILSVPMVIFTEASLSFLGFGIGHGQSFSIGPIELSGVSIGVLLADGQAAMLNRPYLTVFPAIIISILMITFNLFGNALRDAFNPSLRGSE